MVGVPKLKKLGLQRTLIEKEESFQEFRQLTCHPKRGKRSKVKLEKLPEVPEKVRGQQWLLVVDDGCWR